MGACSEWKCNFCGYKVKTSGPWEFYRDTEGQCKPFGHPGPLSQEAKRAGIKGFSTFVYCPGCDRVRDVILIEFETPRDYKAAWSGCKNFSELACPECGGRLYEHLDNLSCSRCKKGVFECTDYWVS